MFWGLIMEPHRRYTQKVKKSFHISMAALDLSTSSEEPAQVMCGFEGRNYLLCTLKKPNVLQCPLNLNFDAGSEVSFAANGKCHIHLTGYLNDDYELLQEETEEEEEEEQEAPIKLKKRITKSGEDGPPTKKSKNGMVTSSQDQDEEEDSDDTDYINTLLGKSLDEDDESDSEVSVDEDEDDDAEEEEGESEDLEEEEEEASSLSEADSDEEVAVSKPKTNGLPPTTGESQMVSQKEKKEIQKKKKKEKQIEQKQKSPQAKSEQKKEAKTPNKENQTPKKKTLQGGVIVEDIKEGQGTPAKNGKFVNVYYEGRLKQNNKMFDSTTKGAGFSFRLGNSEVIKGWDIGVAGMKIGGKRRITCPPAMAYGQKGSPPAIPPNSTLVFEVELRKVN